MMKKLFYLVMTLASCNDKYQSLYDAAPPPNLTFSKDTLNIREKDYSNINSTNNGILWLHCGSANHQFNIQFSDTSGKIHFNYNGLLVQNDQPLIVAGDSTSVFCSCDKAGLYAIDFYLNDQLGKTTRQKLVVNCLTGQKPKAKLSVELTDSSQNENWSYRFDASDCKKSDGIITGYYYNINGQPVITTQPVMNWTFHNRGTHDLVFYVTDDLKQNSDTLHKKIIIP